MNHTLKMIIGCALPLLLIFVLPLFGISEGVTLLVFVVLMLGCHLFMMKDHGGLGKSGQHNHDEPGKRLEKEERS